jgi:enoyl-CoA hydratase
MAKVLYERHGRIARITLNRPAVLNAIDDDLPRELAAAVERADADDAVHVIVLAGAGRAFCAGEKGWKQAVEERDQGTFDWTTYEPIKTNR